MYSDEDVEVEEDIGAGEDMCSNDRYNRRRHFSRRR